MSKRKQPESLLEIVWAHLNKSAGLSLTWAWKKNPDVPVLMTTEKGLEIVCKMREKPWTLESGLWVVNLVSGSSLFRTVNCNRVKIYPRTSNYV